MDDPYVDDHERQTGNDVPNMPSIPEKSTSSTINPPSDLHLTSQDEARPLPSRSQVAGDLGE